MAKIEVETRTEGSDCAQTIINGFHVMQRYTRNIGRLIDGYTDPICATLYRVFASKVLMLVSSVLLVNQPAPAETGCRISAVRIITTEHSGALYRHDFVHTAQGTEFSYGFRLLRSRFLATMITLGRILSDCGGRTILALRTSSPPKA